MTWSESYHTYSVSHVTLSARQPIGHQYIERFSPRRDERSGVVCLPVCLSNALSMCVGVVCCEGEASERIHDLLRRLLV